MNNHRTIVAPVERRPSAQRMRLLLYVAAPLGIGILSVAARASGTPPAPTTYGTPSCTAATCAPTTSAPSTGLPSGGRVQSGTASITQSGDTTTVRQSSQDVSIAWQSFNIGTADTVIFVQPSASALAINRIGSTNGSQILGHLDANGQVWLLNPNGVLFGRGAEVNVGGLVASTLSVNDPGFGSTTFNFTGAGAGSIVNQGTINATPGGYVALLGKSVSNEGTISAKLGTVALGAGSATTLTFGGTGLVKMQVDESTLNAIAQNGGLIQADGGTVVMSAGAKNALLASVVNNTGVIEARTIENHDGTIELLAGMTAGTVTVGGTLDASAPAGGNGGFIATDAAHVHVSNDANVTTLAAAGKAGTWLIDPTDFTIAPSGGDETGAQVGSALTSGNVTIQSSAGAYGTSGNINVDDTVSWSANTLTLNSYNNININSALNGSGSASLALQYGQGAPDGVINGVTASYNVNAPVNLPAGPNFSTLLGSGGTAVNYTVITSLGAAADATTAPMTMTLQGSAATSNLSGNYALGSSIDATPTSTWNGGAGFTPIGNPNTNFTGSFDGLGHTINNLTINLTSTNNVGLFGFTGSSALIQNVGLVGGSVRGPGEAGGLVAVNFGTVNHSFTTGSVNGYGDVGGLVGDNEGDVSNSYSTGGVNGYQSVGGLVGVNQSSIVSSYANGYVNGTADIGGLTGLNQGSVSNSYATGGVGGHQYVGGLLGYNDTSGTVTNTDSTGNVNGSFNIGGLVGSNVGSVSNSFWDTTTSGQRGSAGGSPLTDSQMQSVSSFMGWSISATGGSGDVWRIYQGNTYPLLTSFLTPLTLSAADATATYNGSAQSGATLSAPISGVFGSAATGTNAGFYNGYYSNQQGYDLTGGNLTINPAALTLSGTRVYDGTTVVAGSVLTATGVAGETFAVTGSGDASNLASKDVQTNGTLSSVTGLGLGTSNNGGLASNYTALSTTGSSFSITPLALTSASIASATSVYGSTVTPGAVTLNGVLAADASSVSATASIASPLYSTSNNLRAGSYAQTATLSGGDAFDYTFAGGSSSFTTPTANYTVSPLALTGASIASVSSIYGTPQPAGAVTLTGVIAGDVVGATANIVTPPNSTSGSGNLDAGSYAQTASMLTGADAANYTFAGGYTTPTSNYTVARLALPVSGLSGTNKVYNGSAADPLAGKATIAPLAGDAVTLTGTGASDFANSNVGTGKAVIVSGYSLKGADDANYIIVQPSGLSANVTQLASVAWVGGASGLWSNASNWAGGAIPDYGNVANVTIPTGATVTYDSGVHGTAALSTLTSGGTLVVAAGGLSTSGILTTAGYQQTGGLLDVGGTLSINSLTGGVTLGNVTAGSLSVTSQAGAITQLGSTAIDVTGATSLSAYNGKTGGSATRYNITLAQTGDTFAGAVSANGLNIDLLDKSKSGLIVGSTTATGTLTEDSVAGAITQSASTAITVTGSSSLTADNGLSGGRAVNYNIALAQPADQFGGAVSSTGLNIDLLSSGSLTLGNTNATGGLTATARGGALTQATSTAIDVTGLTSLTADNGVTGKGAVDYAVTLAQPADTLKGAVTAQGSAITLDDAVKLTAILDSTGAVSLDAANQLVVQGTVGTSLTTVTTGGSHSTTTFDATTIGTSLNVTSTGAVATATSSTALTVDGAGTKTRNSNVIVNGVVGAEIK